MLVVVTRWLQKASARPTTSSKKATCWKYFEKVLNSENSTKGKAKYRVSCTFCGDKLAYHGETSAMHEHLKRKHPIETAADQLQPKAAKQMKLEAFTARKTSKERDDHINTLVTGVIVRDLRPVSIMNGDGFKSLMAYRLSTSLGSIFHGSDRAKVRRGKGGSDATVAAGDS